MFGVALEQLVGQVGDLLLCLGRLRGVLDAEGDDHLVLPQRNRVDQGRLNLLHHLSVVLLDKADLRRGLDGDHAGQLQIVNLFLKAVAHGIIIAGGLGVFGEAGGLCLVHELYKPR